jgi:quinol monooxygenase YgiN
VTQQQVVADDDEPVVVVVEMDPAPGRRDDLVEQSRINSERVVNARVGCRSFTIDDQAPDGPVVVLTRWDTRGALSLHLQSTMAATNLDTYIGLLASPMVPRVVPTRRVEETD